eukprot:Phypoly_transcript_31015.p1 GENE.Phypoly_transcript_31015~~Phypoly_transcript_31015.p1  ORF type:complete len:120 (+),score=9.38 Phypoly_transcript_31015:21-380(+)
MGHALVLDTGAGTHFTVVYFNKNRIDACIFSLAKDFCSTKLNLATATLEVGPMWGANSILVNGTLAALKADLTQHFHQLGYDVDIGRRGQTAHINIRGDQKVVCKLLQQVDLVHGWAGM